MPSGPGCVKVAWDAHQSCSRALFFFARDPRGSLRGLASCYQSLVTLLTRNGAKDQVAGGRMLREDPFATSRTHVRHVRVNIVVFLLW